MPVHSRNDRQQRYKYGRPTSRKHPSEDAQRPDDGEHSSRGGDKSSANSEHPHDPQPPREREDGFPLRQRQLSLPEPAQLIVDASCSKRALRLSGACIWDRLGRIS